MIFNKPWVGLTKHYKESEAYKPWAGLSEFDSNESSILHDILYLDSISTVALTMNSVVFSSEHAWKDSFNRFKYYGFRNKFKVFKSYTKNLQTSKVKKPSEVLSEIIFMLPLKLRDAVIEDIDNGVIVEKISHNTFIEDIDNGVIVEKISHNTVIFMSDILLFKNNKQTILDQLKTLVCQVIKQGDRLTVTLEAVLEDKNAYKFYIVLKSSTGDKLYFDFGYDLINAEATEKIMSIFNDVVKTRKEYAELICTVMQEFETLEKELELLVTEFETYVRELLDIQQLNKIITFDNTLKNLAFNKMIGMEKQNKDFETREPWNGLSELVPNETEIIHDIIYLDSLSKLGDIVTKLLGGYKSSRLSTKSFKYYTYRKQYKVFKSYFKHLQTTKEKSSEKLCKVLLTSLLKFRDTFIHDMDYGLLGTEKIPNDLIISLKSILTESPEKQSVKDMLKVNFGDKLKNGGNISVSLEGIADTKNSYTFYITLQSEVGTKLYFDFGYDQITAEKAHTLMAVYNDIVVLVKDTQNYIIRLCYNLKL